MSGGGRSRQALALPALVKCLAAALLRITEKFECVEGAFLEFVQEGSFESVISFVMAGHLKFEHRPSDWDALICRLLFRRTGYVGQRFGEASNPGPVEDAQMALLVQLIQSMMQLVAQIASGRGIDVSSQMASVNSTLGALQKGAGNQQQVQPRKVTFAEADDGWKEVPRRHRRKGHQESDVPKLQDGKAKGKGKGKATSPGGAGDRGKGKGGVALKPPEVPKSPLLLRAADWAGTILLY